MNLRDPAPEEMERVRELARRFGRDEAEERRLIALGRRAEELLGRQPECLAVNELSPQAAVTATLSWIRRELLGAQGSLATGGINPAEEMGYAEAGRAARQRRDAPIPLVPFEEDDDGA